MARVAQPPAEVQNHGHISQARAHKQPPLFDFNSLDGDGGKPSMEKLSENARALPESTNSLQYFISILL